MILISSKFDTPLNYLEEFPLNSSKASSKMNMIAVALVIAQSFGV